MQHIYEFIVKEKDKEIPIVHKRFITESGRISKATKSIAFNLYKHMGIIINQDKELYVKKIR